MKNAEFQNKQVQVQKIIGKSKAGYKSTQAACAPAFGFCHEVTKSHIVVELLVGCDTSKIIFLKRAGYFDYRGGRYQISLKNA